MKGDLMCCAKRTADDKAIRPGLEFLPARFLVTAMLLIVGIPTAPAKVKQLPPPERTAEEFKQYQEKVDWFFEAKYGIMFHFVPNMHRFNKGRIKWDHEKWNTWVEAVDVDKVARQAQEAGAGYVILSISQGGGYACAPNPVIRKYWGIAPGEYTSNRDLPMDLHHALKKYDIPLMLYFGCTPHLLPGKASEKAGWFGTGYKFKRCTPEGAERWAEVLQWYSKHYGGKCSGWWLDGCRDWAPGYRQRVHQAAISGNPRALTASGTYALSDFDHGHCVSNWKVQQKRLPMDGRWKKHYQIQWHAFQYLGRSWAARNAAHSTDSVVRYASNIVRRGGVITFDVGTFEEKPKIIGPYLSISEPQMKQLRAVRKAIEPIER